MAIDNVLLRFAGEDTVSQSQSLSGLPMSSALPSTLAMYDFNLSGVTGSYPVPGIEFVDAHPATGTWGGYQDFVFTLTTTVNHGTSSYNVQIEARLPTSGSSDFSYTQSTGITVPAGLTSADPVVFTYYNGNKYVKLRITIADLVDGVGTVHTFQIPGARRSVTGMLESHTGAWVSAYAPSISGATLSMALLEHFLQLISIRGSSVTSVELNTAGDGSATVRINGLFIYGTAGDLNFTGNVKYLRYGSTSYGAVLRYDSYAGARSVFVSSSGTQYRVNAYGSASQIIPVAARAKNSLLPQAYKNHSTFRAYYLENISGASLEVLFGVSGAATGLYIYNNRLVDPDTYWVVGDGLVTGVVPAGQSTGNYELNNVLRGPIPLAAGQVAGIRLDVISSATVTAESQTQIVLVAA